MPHIDPNIVLWCNIASDIITSLAAMTAAIASVKHYMMAIKDKLKNI